MRRCVSASLCLFVLCVSVSAQVRPRATVTPIPTAVPAHAGETARLAVKVSLPEGLHTQSNKPRDPLLIPTELTFTPPDGVTIEEIVWPPSQDLNQVGQDKPLAVFEREFLIGVQVKLPPAQPAGALTIPAHL